VYSVLCDLGLGHLEEQDVLNAPLVGGLKGHEVVSLGNEDVVRDLGPEAGQFPWFSTVEGDVEDERRHNPPCVVPGQTPYDRTGIVGAVLASGIDNGMVSPSAGPDLRSDGEVVELNVVPLDAGVLDQFKSKLA
jgi:hypothetical protein